MMRTTPTTSAVPTTPTPPSAPTPAASAPDPRRRAPRKTPAQIVDEREALAREYPVHVGVDTGKAFHKLVARGPDGRRRKAVRVDVSRAGFEAADQYLAVAFPGVPRQRVLVGVEFAGHNGFTFAYFLARRGYKIVSVLPSVTKKLREIEDNSPQKDDARDAAQICKLLASGLFVTFPLLDGRGAELRLLATERQRLAVEGTRLKNRLHSVLDLAWPEFLGQFSALEKRTPVVVLERWQVPEDLTASGARTVHAIVRRASRNHIGAERVRALLEAARTTIAMREGTAARRAEIRRLLERWRLLRRHVREVETRLAELVAEHPAATAVLTVPEVGVVCAATLVAELGDPAWYESPRQVLKLAGMNLASKESGTSVRGRVKQTKHGRPLLRRQLFLLAGRWCMTRGLYREHYVALLRRGVPRTSAVCAVARKLVPMLFAVMRTGEPFDLVRWRSNRVRAAGAAGAAGAGSPYRPGKARP
jgi:transposase